MIEAFALATGLAMDATAVAAARALHRPRRIDVVLLPLLFGAAQAGMAALGWAIGAWGGELVRAWDHWIAFVLLAGLGGKMIADSWRPAPPSDALPTKTQQTPLVYLGLAIATSIDAAAAGITLPLLPVAPELAIAIVGGVTAVFVAVGYLVGRAAGERFGPRLGVVGGVILVGIGVKVLVEHL